MTFNPVKGFSVNDQDTLKEKLIDLLWQRGVRMDHDGILKILAQAGARVNMETKQVQFPRDLLDELIKKVPNNLLLSAMNPAFDLKIPCTNNGFCVRTGTGAPNYLDPDTGIYRRIQIADIANWARLVGELEHIDICAFPSPGDVSPKTADIHALRVLFENSPKHIWVQPYSVESIEYLFKLAEIASEGTGLARQQLPVSFITGPLSPFYYKYMDLEVVLQACRRGVPIHVCSLPSAGATSPVTMSGTVLLAATEIIVLLAVAQAINPGTPGIATPLIFTTDMLTGRTLQCSVEAIMGAAAAVSFIKNSFGIPTHTYAFDSDSPDADFQAQSERSFLSLMVALAGSDILGGAGQIEVATTISPLQLIIDNDLAGMVHRLKNSSISIDDENLAWSDLLNVQPGGHFLNNEHTLKNCRNAFKPLTFIRQSRETWLKKGKNNIFTKAKEIYNEIMSKERVPLLTDEALKEMDLVVTTAERQLVR